MMLDTCELDVVRRHVPKPEYSILLRSHPNLLIEGAESTVSDTVVGLKSVFYPRLCLWPQTCASLTCGEPATLIVPEVDRLTTDALEQLCACLDCRLESLQVVATSSTRLCDRVNAGSFSSDLYFRLNHILLRIDG